MAARTARPTTPPLHAPPLARLDAVHIVAAISYSSPQLRLPRLLARWTAPCSLLGKRPCLHAPSRRWSCPRLIAEHAITERYRTRQRCALAGITRKHGSGVRTVILQSANPSSGSGKWSTCALFA